VRAAAGKYLAIAGCHPFSSVARIESDESPGIFNAVFRIFLREFICN